MATNRMLALQNNFDYAHGDVFLATGGLEKYKNSYFNA